MAPKKILVVDDNPDILESVKLLLEFEDYQVQTLTKGSDIFKLEQKDYPDIILLDMWLSGEDGRDICRSLKSHEKMRHIPVMIISASHGLEQTSYDAGADAFVSKPFDINEVLAKISEFVK